MTEDFYVLSSTKGDDVPVIAENAPHPGEGWEPATDEQYARYLAAYEEEARA